MKSSYALRFILLLALTCLPLQTFAWNCLGHMVIANIAYQNLKPEVRTKVDTLVSFFQKEYPEVDSFIKLSCWPDMIRSQNITTFVDWHYINVPFSDDGTPLKNIVDKHNVVWAINNVEKVVKYSHVNIHERARFLAFLGHFLADIHQPLHTVSRVSVENPDGDKGGNLYHVKYNGAKMNLHQLWDKGLGLYESNQTVEHAKAISQSITTHYPHNYFGEKLYDFNLDNWTKDGMQTSKQYVYKTPQNQTPSAEYMMAGKKIVEQQTALAGYRMATILNQLLS